LRLCVLASGSGGNCSLLDTPQGVVVIDAGIAPRAFDHRLSQCGLTWNNIRAVCLTHLDRDHFRPQWLPNLAQAGVPIFVHRWHAPELWKVMGVSDGSPMPPVVEFDGEPFAITSAPGLRATTLRVQHDLQGTIAYRFEHEAGSLGFVTDLGHAPPPLIEHLAGVDVLAIESNYDPMMQMSADRPFFVKRRCLSDSGHLSNEQALEAVSAIVARSPHGRPHHIVLLHRSSHCNHIARIERVFSAEPTLLKRLVMTHQRRRTRWIAVRGGHAGGRAQRTLAQA
jgi:phosphoribosyl 1,2-cyclic phosphodiesterase